MRGVDRNAAASCHARPALGCRPATFRTPVLPWCYGPGRHGLLAVLDVIHAYVPRGTLQWAKPGEGALLAPRNLLQDALILYNEDDSPRFSRYTQARELHAGTCMEAGWIMVLHRCTDWQTSACKFLILLPPPYLRCPLRPAGGAGAPAHLPRLAQPLPRARPGARVPCR